MADAVQTQDAGADGAIADGDPEAYEGLEEGTESEGGHEDAEGKEGSEEGDEGGEALSLIHISEPTRPY